MIFSLLEKKLKEIAPPELGFMDDLYGLQLGSKLKDRSIKKILVCLDPTKKVIIEAIKQKIHFIISHHGITHQPKLYFDDSVLEQIKLCALHDIDLFVIHSAWDAAEGGISESFAKTLGLDITNVLCFPDREMTLPIGRICCPIQSQLTLQGILNNIKRHLHVQNIQYCGKLQDKVEKIGVVGGKGLHEEDVKIIVENGCDTFITGEVSYSVWLMAQKLNLKLITTTHYASEIPGMKNLARILSLTFPLDEIVFFPSDDPISYYREDKNA